MKMKTSHDVQTLRETVGKLRMELLTVRKENEALVQRLKAEERNESPSSKKPKASIEDPKIPSGTKSR